MVLTVPKFRFFPNQKGQASLEYLLLVTAFFAILGVILPVASNTVDSFISASDDLLASSISDELSENISLFSFLGEGTVRTFEYSPAKMISFSSAGTKLIVSSSSKSFEIDTGFVQVIPKTDFEENFSLILSKSEKGISVSFSK